MDAYRALCAIQLTSVRSIHITPTGKIFRMILVHAKRRVLAL